MCGWRNRTLLREINRLVYTTPAWSLHSDSAPPPIFCTAQDCPSSEQQQDVQDEEWVIFWNGLTVKASMVCAVPKTTVVSMVCCPKLCWSPKFHVPTAGSSSVDVPGQSYWWRPYRCPWPLLLLRMVSMVCVGTEGCVHICSLYCHWGPLWGLCWYRVPCGYISMVHAVARNRKSMTHVPTNDKGKDAMKKHRSLPPFSPLPPCMCMCVCIPPKSNSLDIKTLHE